MFALLYLKLQVVRIQIAERVPVVPAKLRKKVPFQVAGYTNLRIVDGDKPNNVKATCKNPLITLMIIAIYNILATR